MPAIASILDPPRPDVQAPTDTMASRGPRFDAPDLLRGAIMAIMLLDHTRDFVHWSSIKFEPTDLTQTSVPLFLTRWITHYCAPLFVFLAGMAISFQEQRGRTGRALSMFLVKRGLWLCLLELVLIRTLIFWQPVPQILILQVIWALGVSMICLALFVRLPRWFVLALSLALVLGHNLFDGIHAAAWAGPASPVPAPGDKGWLLLHQVGAFPIVGWPSPVMFVQYPLLPWMGVMALGWLAGPVYQWSVTARRAALIRTGLALIAAFFVIRLLDHYGDPAPWTSQRSAVFTALSFLNVTKYPPSLDFLLMTLGPGLVVLGLLERQPTESRGGLARALLTLGRVPLFFYILQWVYAKTAAYIVATLAGRDTTPFFQYPPDFVWNERVGFDLWVVYAIWFVGVVLLYFACRWYSRVKARRRDWWLGYL